MRCIVKITAPQNLLPEHGYIRQAELLRLLPFSPSTLWRLVAANKFVQPVRLSERVTAWPVKDVRDWIESRKTAA